MEFGTQGHGPGWTLQKWSEAPLRWSNLQTEVCEMHQWQNAGAGW